MALGAPELRRSAKSRSPWSAKTAWSSIATAATSTREQRSRSTASIEADIHDGCREKYTLDLAVEQVHSALKVRLPLGMEVWALERARNIVDGLRADFILKLR